MPELPEVETIARHLNEALPHRTFGRVVVSRTDIIHGDPRPLGGVLTGRRILSVRRRAKRLVIELEPDIHLVFHLGMSGRLTLSPYRRPIEPHTHLRIVVRGTGQELRFRDPRRFGGVWCLTGNGEYVGKRLGKLGLEPLDMTLKDFRRLVDRNRQIKALLLDQGIIAGLGNIYCDESLHAAGIHPLTPASALDPAQVPCLLKAIKGTLRKAIRFKGTTLIDYRTADGLEGSFRTKLRVYHREGQPCQTCGTAIERLIVAGRSTFICPQCQA
jgi:formamidopyrimidine-DNA glycosylase